MSKNKKIIAVTSVFLLVFAGLMLYRYFKPIHKNSNNTNQQEAEIKIDTENDGVYYNFKYNFSFEYPQDMFEYQSPIGNFESLVLCQHFVEDSPYGDNCGGIRIILGVYDTESELNNFNKNYSRNIGDKEESITGSQKGFSIVLDKFGENGIQGYAMKKYTYGDVEPSLLYNIAFVKNDKLISISIVKHDTIENSSELEKIFKQVYEGLNI